MRRRKFLLLGKNLGAYFIINNTASNLDFATGINSGNKEPVKGAALFDERVKKEELGIWN